MKKNLLFVFSIFLSLICFNALNITIAGTEDNPKQETSTQQNTESGDIPSTCLNGMGNRCFSFDKLIHGTGSEITGTNENKTVTTIAQDVILAATYMVGTVLTIIIIYCGLMYIFAARGGKDNASQYKTGLINAAIGAILVRGAYAIVRLIQYIAKG